MHNHDDKKGMMWMMLICCATPFVLLLFASNMPFLSGYIRYLLIGVLAAACLWMMFRRHGEDDTKGSSDQSGAEGKSKRDGRCH